MAAYKMAAVKVTPPNDFPLGLIRSHMVVIHLFLMLCDLQRVVRDLYPTLYISNKQIESNIILYILESGTYQLIFLFVFESRYPTRRTPDSSGLWQKIIFVTCFYQCRISSSSLSVLPRGLLVRPSILLGVHYNCES
jgi:hypothetical protein